MSTSAAAKSVKQAVRYLRRHGLEAGRPVNHMEAMMSDREGALAALATTLERAADHDLAPAVRLARLLDARELSDAIAARTLRRPAPLEAKVEALDALAELGVEIPASVSETLTAVQGFIAAPDAAGLDRVLALPESWSRPAIAAWLEHGPHEVELLERLLASAPELEEQVIDCLGDSASDSAVAVLHRLEEGADKERRKQVRRALHRLRAAGIETEEKADPGESFSFAIEADPREARAWSSGIDGGGGRIVWLLAPAPRGGEELLEAVFDDVDGLRRAETMSVTRKGFRGHLDRLRENPAILVVQLAVEEAAAALRDAEERAASAGGEIPGDYRRWKEGIGGKLLAMAPPPTAEEPGAGLITDPSGKAAGDVDRDRLRDSVELLKDPVFANWAILGEAAEEAALGVRRAETSELVVDDEQRKQQVDEAIASAARGLDDELRGRYRRRLHTMADLLERVRRTDDAALARAAAAGIESIDDLYTGHPFVRAMVQRGVLAAYQGVREREGDDEPESRIVRP